LLYIPIINSRPNRGAAESSRGGNGR
jgi:hypothetical protein